MVRRRPAEVHVNQERWLVSYADFITLLFAFFVVMYSISQVNQSKYRVLSETFDHAFNAPNPLQAEVLDTTAQPKSPIQLGEPSLAPDSSAVDAQHENLPVAANKAVDPLEEISAQFTERFADLIDDELVMVSSNELWLQIELKDSILFASGDTEPSLQAQAIFDEIAGILKDFSHPVQVEGFTDNVPINTERFPSNWELSSARASTVVKWLAAKGVAPQRLSAVGYGEYQPISSNQTAEGRADNRRIALLIARRKLERPDASMPPPHRATKESVPQFPATVAPTKSSTPDAVP